MTKKKLIIVLSTVLVLAILCFPIKSVTIGGGITTYSAITYQVSQHNNRVQSPTNIKKMGYNYGTKVRILLWEVYNDVKFIED